MLVTIQDGDETYWLPLLTHVEQVADVLASIGQILADTPDAAATRKAQRVAASAPTNGPPPVPPPAIRRGASCSSKPARCATSCCLARVPFETLLFVKRKPFFSEQPFMDAHHLFNRPGGGIYRLSPVRPDGRVTPVVDTLGEGVYRDLCLHWDARRLLFAWGNGSDSWDGKLSYHIYEVGVDGGGLRQITTGPKNDCEPFYLPNGQIGFTSDRSEHFVMCGGDRHSPNLFVTDAAGTDVRRLSFNVFNDYNPAVLPDGRIIYGRWEYNERSVTSLHNPFTMHPDGRMVSPYYGNATIRPNVVMFPRPVPGSNLVMALFTAHHGQTHGAVGLIDVRRGIDGPKPLTVLTPNVPITGEKAEDSRAGWFSDPLPLDENTWLCSYTPTVLPWLETTWALYVADRHGNLGLVYRDPDISCAEPVPLVPRPQPHVLPPAPAETGFDETRTPNWCWPTFTRVCRTFRAARPSILRILEDVPRESVHRGGVVCTSGTLIFTVKRVLGTVPDRAGRLRIFHRPRQPQRLFRGAGRRPPGDPADAQRRVPEARRAARLYRLPRTAEPSAQPQFGAGLPTPPRPDRRSPSRPQRPSPSPGLTVRRYRRKPGRPPPCPQPTCSAAVGHADPQLPARRSSRCSTPAASAATLSTGRPTASS